MTVAYLPAFVRDLKRLRGTRDYERIWHFASGLGTYRVGFYWDGENLIFARVLHRKEIYRFFP